MRKGQLFILTAIVICVGISALANAGYVSSKTAEAGYAKALDSDAILRNIEHEIVELTNMDPTNLTRIYDFVNYAGNITQDKRYDLKVYVKYVNDEGYYGN